MKRNLLFFICPFFSNEEWINNVKTISRYLDVFNGNIVICIVSGKELYAYKTVRKNIEKFFSKREVCWLNVENDPNLGEGQGFIPLMKCVESTDTNDITFYCHAKGVSPGKTIDELKAVRIWRQLMYSYCLGDPLRIDAVLAKWACCGCFKKYGRHHLSTGASWHFSGTFFWFRNDKVFNNANWDKVIYDRYWVEGFLSQFIRSEDAFCLFGNDPWPSNLYKYTINNWLQFYKIPNPGMKYIPQKASDALTDLQKISLIQNWREIDNQDTKTLFLRKEGVEIDELNEWNTQFNIQKKEI